MRTTLPHERDREGTTDELERLTYVILVITRIESQSLNLEME